MVIKNIHDKLLEGIKSMILDLSIDLPYYGEFNLHINFHERKNIPTCAVNMTAEGMNFHYNSEFLNKLPQKEVNFIILHENFHLLFDHPTRTVLGNYDHRLSNIVQDMIINHIIWNDISHNFVDIPKDEEGKNMALFVPKEYEGNLIFEELYDWMKEKKDEHDKNPNNNKSDYGPYGKDNINTYSLESIFDNMMNGDTDYLDVHIDDEISEQEKRTIIEDIKSKVESRGLMSGKTEETLNKLVKKRKDYLKEIKRTISSTIFGGRVVKSISKPNRRSIDGLKGKRKIKSKINVGLDTSGSMGGTFEKILSYIYQNDIEINFMESDTEVKWVKNLKSRKDIESIPIKGLGGTALQPMVDYISDNFNSFNNVILTDGYCDSLDFSRIKGKTLIISIGVKCPISYDNGRIKQIIIEK